MALAASYHATRAASPLHPDRRIFEEEAAYYLPVRERAWREHRLVPVPASCDPGGRSFEAACRQLSGMGLPVEAWIVLTHNATLGAAHPEVVVHNAYGDGYPYALCPANQDVQQYCLTLTQETLRSAPVTGVVLESCGPMGIDHAGAHEKTEFAEWGDAQRALLSLCFCPACVARYDAAGIDSEQLAETVRTGVDSDAASIEECLGNSLAAQVAAVRTDLAGALRALLAVGCHDVRPDVRVAVHASADPWATGSFATVSPEVGDGVHVVVASCWDAPTGAERIRDLRDLASPATRLGAYLRLDRGWSAGESTDRRLADYLSAGMDEVHLYHLGLLGRRGLTTLREVVHRARQLAA